MESMQRQENPPKKKKKQNNNDKTVKSFARYSGIAIQMVAIIGLMTWAGVKLDERRASDIPVFTIILSLLGVFAGIYTAIKDFIGKK